MYASGEGYASSAAFLERTYLTPMICTVIRGIMATSATVPKASVRILPPTALQTPMAKGSMKVADIGPDATPPESKAIAVNMGGTKNDSPKAIRYPGTTIHKMLIPVRTLIMESAMAKAMAS